MSLHFPLKQTANQTNLSLKYRLLILTAILTTYLSKRSAMVCLHRTTRAKVFLRISQIVLQISVTLLRGVKI